MYTHDMTPQEYLKFLEAEICCVTQASKIDSTRASWEPSMKLLAKAPASLLADKSFGRYVTLLQIKAMMEHPQV
jgi:hypothetical protein